MKEDKKFSERISDIVKLFDEISLLYPYVIERMQNEERLTQDYLHQLELEELKYKDRAKVATQLSLNRKNRRGYKDCVEEIKPIVDYIEANKKAINNLKQMLGEVRKQEKKHNNRKYFPRIMKFTDYKKEIQ